MEQLLAYWPHVAAALAGVAAILSSVHVVLNKRDPRAAALWMGLIWLSPAIGSVLYLLIGINRMPRRAAVRALAARQLAVLSDHISERTPSADDHPLTVGNEISPLYGGDVAYPEMLAAIAQARDSILLCTYIFDNDRAGKQFVAALAAAVQRGVDVRVVIDAVGARYSVPSIVGPLRRGGVKVARFSRTIVPWRLRYANLRNHRKIMVVDGLVGFTGGMNIREDCLLALKPSTPTLDLHFRVEGPVVAELQRTLVEDWEFCTGDTLDTERYFPPLERRGDVVARAIPDGPDLPNDPVLWTRLAAIGRARSRVRIATPYFVPEPPALAALGVAAANGVHVELVLPAINNLLLVQWASTALLPELLERNCHVYLAPPPFDHSKLMVIDEDWANVGSANWDARSFRLNFEFDLECRSPSLAKQLHDLLDRRVQGAKKLTLASVRDRPLALRLRDGAAYVLAPYL
jgi:cardiolipin synthase A/B